MYLPNMHNILRVSNDDYFDKYFAEYIDKYFTVPTYWSR